MLKKPVSEIRWETKNGSVIFGGEPASPNGIERGLSQRLGLLENLGPGTKVLSIGCGTATDLKKLLVKHNIFAVGLDAQRTFLMHATASKPKTVGLLQATAENLPVRDQSFDLVLLLEVLEHVEDPETTLQEIGRVLKTNGTLLLSVPNRFYFFETHGIQISKSSVDNLLGIGIPFFSWVPNILRKRFERARIYNQSQMAWLLRSKNFEIETIKYLMPPFDKMKTSALIEALRRISCKLSNLTVSKMFGANIMILAKKAKKE